MSTVRAFLRIGVLAAIVAAAVFALRWARETDASGASPIAYVATAHQLGVVGYRDPPGALSSDAQRVAYAEGRRLYEALTAGGAAFEIATGEGQIRHVAPIGTSGEWLFEDTASPTRWWAASPRAPMRPLFGDAREVQATIAGESRVVSTNTLRQLVVSPDGRRVAAVVSGPSGVELWRVSLDASAIEAMKIDRPMAFPAWRGDEVACTVRVDGGWRLAPACDQPVLRLNPDVEVIGPLAFSANGGIAYFASPNDRGFVDLWSADLVSRRARRLTSFARDTYAPSVAADGTVLFKTQIYRTSVAERDLVSGETKQVSSLQAETPSYHPAGQAISVTYGTWRRVVDDAKYPDIAQEIGVLRAWPDRPAASPLEVIAASDSEDQAMSWSPNGKWIALHSHREQSDDIWVRPVDEHAPDRRVSFLGRGAEVGWPRWSPDGRFVLYDGASPSHGRSVPFVVGLDQETGHTTSPAREVVVTGLEGEMTHAEWLPDSATMVAIAKEGAGRHAIVKAPVSGGPAEIVHRFASEHDFPGLAVSPDGRTVAFVAPAPDGFYQLFRLPVSGGTAEQITFDRSHKTQPAWSPDGRRMAFTIWSYEAQFWTMK
jgi:Tol biopolymer transport system component